jgi:hypothetical protein
MQCMNTLKGHSDFLRKKDEGIGDYLRHYEKLVFAETYTELSESYREAWEKISLLITQLYEAKMLESFLDPGVSVKDYCRRLIEKLDQLEKKYAVKYKKESSLVGQTKEESFVKELRDRAPIVNNLFAIKGTCLMFNKNNKSLSDLEKMYEKLCEVLEDAGWERQTEVNTFFEQFQPDQSQNPITPLFQRMAAAPRKPLEKNDETASQVKKKRCFNH